MLAGVTLQSPSPKYRCLEFSTALPIWNYGYLVYLYSSQCYDYGITSCPPCFVICYLFILRQPKAGRQVQINSHFLLQSLGCTTLSPYN
ncbi:hypothetical protein LY78DRAFT_380088 [Colletotrichum sublineola]|nr:hypothetical protein LY78DRAFT_380088 [Colletotrichum sublineola]